MIQRRRRNCTDGSVLFVRHPDDRFLSFHLTRPRRGSGYCSSPFRAGNLALGIVAVSPASQPNARIIAKPPRPNQAQRFFFVALPSDGGGVRTRRPTVFGHEGRVTLPSVATSAGLKQVRPADDKDHSSLSRYSRRARPPVAEIHPSSLNGFTAFIPQ